MNLKDFMMSLLPSFAKESVLDDCQITATEIKDYTKLAYQQAVPLYHNWKFKSADVLADFETFDRMVKGKNGDNPIETIFKGFDNVLHNLQDCAVLIDKTYSQEIAGGGFTYQKANLLQFVEACAFVSKYARKFLMLVNIRETVEMANSDEQSSEQIKVTDSLAPAEIEWLRMNLVSFCTLFNVTTGEPNNVRKAIAEIPDVVITAENAETLAATIGDKKIDPFEMKLIPVWLNPIYHVRIRIAEWQTTRYKAAKEELQLLQLQKLAMQKQSEGKPDAHLQKQIKYMEGRIQGLNYKIAEMEKNYG